MHDWIEEVGWEAFAKFTQPIHRIKIFSIASDKFANVRLSSSTSKSKIARLFKFLGLLKGDRELYCSVDYSDDRALDEKNVYWCHK
jgi:hypothetical protein